MVVEINVLWPQSVAPDKLLVSRRSLVLAVARQHALEAHAHALDVLHRTPALRSQKVKTYDAIGVDVRVDGNRTVVFLDKSHLWRFYGILAAESELQPVDLALVDGVLIENLYVEEPFFEIVGRDQGDAWGQAAVYLLQFLAKAFRCEIGDHVDVLL